jgi:hypothetical protein
VRRDRDQGPLGHRFILPCASSRLLAGLTARYGAAAATL